MLCCVRVFAGVVLCKSFWSSVETICDWCSDDGSDDV